MTPRAAPPPPPAGWTFETKVHFRSGKTGQKRLREGEAPVPVPVEPGSVPRVARLLALAHRFRDLVASGEVRDYADLARLGAVSRPRLTQIMNLLLLAPDIQEAVLDLPRTLYGKDPVSEVALRPIAAVPDWATQREMWRALKAPDSERVDLDVSPSPRPHVSGEVAKGAPRKRRTA